MTGNVHYWRKSYISDCLDREFNRERIPHYTAALQGQQEARSLLVPLCCYAGRIQEVYSILSDDLSLGCLENEIRK
jgi:hypothetical protein